MDAEGDFSTVVAVQKVYITLGHLAEGRNALFFASADLPC
jgi:hypothetical protein